MSILNGKPLPRCPYCGTVLVDFECRHVIFCDGYSRYCARYMCRCCEATTPTVACDSEERAQIDAYDAATTFERRAGDGV